MHPCQNDSRSFFQKLQSAKGLDLRDNRGKRHDLAIVLVGVTLAVLANRDGCLSSVHRHLVNHYPKLAEVLRIEKKSPVSRSQLPIILQRVSVEVFDSLIFVHFGVHLSDEQRKWFAIDGKELRGSIESGARRGEAIVQAVTQKDRQVAAQDYYCGKKESEVPVVRKLLRDNGLSGQKISLDALHCKPKTLEIITQATGKYVVGLKSNQKHLLGQIERVVAEQVMLWKISEIEKGHGRIEQRSYEFYDILELETAERWKDCQLRTVVKVERWRKEVKTEKVSQETSYYLTNEVGNYEEMAGAIRRHWQVETNNHIRDVTLREDALRSKKRNYKKQWRASEQSPARC